MSFLYGLSIIIIMNVVGTSASPVVSCTKSRESLLLCPVPIDDQECLRQYRHKSKHPIESLHRMCNVTVKSFSNQLLSSPPFASYSVEGEEISYKVSDFEDLYIEVRAAIGGYQVQFVGTDARTLSEDKAKVLLADFFARTEWPRQLVLAICEGGVLGSSYQRNWCLPKKYNSSIQ